MTSYEAFRKQLRSAEYEVELKLSAYSSLLVSKDFTKAKSLEQEIQGLLNQVRSHHFGVHGDEPPKEYQH